MGKIAKTRAERLLKKRYVGDAKTPKEKPEPRKMGDRTEKIGSK